MDSRKVMKLALVSLVIITQGVNALTLLKSGEEVLCIDRSALRHDDYCLSVDMSTAKDSEFQCFFNNHFVYGCKANGTCEEGVLRNIAFPRDDNLCTGIALTDINGSRMGTYICLQKGSKILQTLFLSYCNTTDSRVVTQSTTTDSNKDSGNVASTKTEDAGLKFVISGVVVGLILLFVLAPLLSWVIYRKYYRKGQHPLPQNDPPGDV